jgi:phosphatidylinositol alpha-1,6-mannosyltransferase
MPPASDHSEPRCALDQGGTIGLLASEVTTRGGIQSFMLRVAEVLRDARQSLSAGRVHCVSLNDTTESLHAHAAMPGDVEVWGAGRSKIRLVMHCIRGMPRTQFLLVGHLALAPVAHILNMLGRVDRYVVILHGVEAWKAVSVLERRALLSADRILATTQFTAHECGRANRIPSARFQVIPLCVEEPAPRPSKAFRLHGGVKMLCVGRLDPTERYKGFERVFEALGRLSTSHPELQLHVVGGGDDQPRLAGIAKALGVDVRVTFWGRLSDADLAAAYQDCDIFVLPSKKEGFGIVFLEAMRFSKPCIGGRHGGTPEVIEHGDSGYLVDYDDVDALARCIRGLAENELLRTRMGERGRELFQARYRFEVFAARYLAVIAGRPRTTDARV